MRLRYLFVAPQLGFDGSGQVAPGGLLQLGRCIARALAASPGIRKLGVWCQLDPAPAAPEIENMLRPYARPGLELDIRGFGGSRIALAAAIAGGCARRRFDGVMYGHVNQAQLAILPGHPPHDAWLIGVEVFQRLGSLKLRPLQTARRLLSISQHTTRTASLYNPGLENVPTVPLCIEPGADDGCGEAYEPAARERAVLILANMHREHLYKGHQQLIAGWRQVTARCPDAELWIAGQGDGEPLLRELANLTPPDVRKNIRFLGRLSPAQLDDRFRRARVFAMPSTAEGFGLVFVEAARYGIPCIAGLYDSVKEIVMHGETGLLVEQDPHDIALACLKLLTDDDLARRLGEAGRWRALDRYQFEHFARRLHETLNLGSPERCRPAPLLQTNARSLRN